MAGLGGMGLGAEGPDGREVHGVGGVGWGEGHDGMGMQGPGACQVEIEIE